ncbi:unnamed protein product [Ambrosiozyma monospora]|uniref:Unnamed protein product n=1 Tax=Ambrosiozyma monospora TaxID=43982 RepID=A0ACB5UDA2_AMBMO|nr:unnamed protein product [Ambrosiozyma monospora]
MQATGLAGVRVLQHGKTLTNKRQTFYSEFLVHLKNNKSRLKGSGGQVKELRCNSMNNMNDDSLSLVHRLKIKDYQMSREYTKAVQTQTNYTANLYGCFEVRSSILD